MADKYALNYTMPNGPNNPWSAVWKLTRVMKAAGWTTVAHSDGTTKTAAGTNNNDSWGSNADPLTDAYPSFDSAFAWIVMRGPSTVKIPFITAPVGTFVRGEPVTQATSGATGELLGIVWDSSLATGWAIIQPRTGTFDGTHTVIGSVSAATFTASSVKTFFREIVFAKSNNLTDGTRNYVCADSVGESSSLFSTLAASAGCTATVFPGGGGTGNGFPSIAICERGTGGSVSHTQWFFLATSNFTGFANMACVNATPASGVSADGSFYCMVGRVEVTGAQGMFGFFRVDDGEPGDVDPYVFYSVQANTMNAFTRTTASSYYNVQYENWVQMGGANRVFGMFKGYAARDGYVTARDVVVPFEFTYKNAAATVWFPQMLSAQPNPINVQNVPTSDFIFAREPMGLVTDGQTSNIRMIKGHIRWMQLTSNGQYKDTFDGKKWIVLIPFLGSNSAGVIVGPWDGSTTPV